MTRHIARALLAIAIGTNAPLAAAQERAKLAGDWIADLRPTPQAPAHLKPMTLTIAPDGTLTGSFYEHPIDLGQAGATNDRPCFAFRTHDGTGDYQSSGCLIGDRIEGQTWSEGRRFILTWAATRNQK